MTRNIMTTAAAVAALAAAPAAFASQNNDPVNTTAAEADAIVTSNQYIPNQDDTVIRNGGETDEKLGIDSARIEAEQTSPAILGVSASDFEVMTNVVGADFRTTDGEMLGKVTDVTVNTLGNPELEIDVSTNPSVEGDRLVLTLLPGSFNVADGKLFIDATAEEIYGKAAEGGNNDNDTRKTAIIS
ncbi:PRC-barrel domain-containing protein [Sulfitobacter sp. S190]|uniref:PRC-barrel domain-containing protein n=1 Tax=Sulfitobacter sp. S190 TaxID=2867022 RepID=UPI0021A5CF0C|nr:PRC-barrel domain-containing protein [Sulfitobacter sp. S190]UWR23744.1 PRC-barrel domain-containing protein [Sulfitobacter sp. S190]